MSKKPIVQFYYFNDRPCFIREDMTNEFGFKLYSVEFLDTGRIGVANERQLKPIAFGEKIIISEKKHRWKFWLPFYLFLPHLWDKYQDWKLKRIFNKFNS
jgi:hypothetical protein